MKTKPFNISEDKSLHASIREGVSASAMMGMGENYIGPFGIFLQASTIQVGLLATVPQLFSALMQYYAARRMPQFRSRRKVVLTGTVAQASFWIPVALIPFFFGTGTFSVFLLILLVTLYRGTNGIIVPVWSSLIGDLVSEDIRGRFFGHRNRLTGMSSFLALLLAGVILHSFETDNAVATGYLMIFALACLFRLNSAWWVRQYEDPELHIGPKDDFSFRQFLRRSPHSNFAKFVFYVGAINLAVSFSGPYFALYMLRDLQFSYLEFTFVSAASTITQFLTFRYWGELSDRFGNKKILTLCGWGIAAVPGLWVLSSNIAYVTFVQICAGFVWAGFGLASGNFLFDAVTPPKRALCVAYQGLINGMCILVGSTAGGYLAMRLPKAYTLNDWTWEPVSTLLVLFVISACARVVASGFLLRKFREVRTVEPIGDGELIFHITHLKPIAGATFNLVTGIFNNRKNGGSDKRQDNVQRSDSSTINPEDREL